MSPGLAIAALALVQGPAADEPAAPGVAFEWRAPADCPDADGFFARLRARAPKGELARLHGHAHVEREPAGYVAAISIVTADGARDDGSLRAADCDLLAEIVAVKVALALAPVAPAIASTIAPADVARPSPPPRRPVAAAASRPPPTPPRWHGLATAAAAAELGVLPALGGRVVLGLGIRGSRWRTDLLASYVPPRTVVTRSTLVRMQLASATARACLVASIGPVDGAWCAGFEAGAVVARGIALPTVHRTTRPWAAALAGALFVWPRDGAIRLVVGLEGGVAVLRPALDLDDDRLLWRAPRAHVRAIGGAEIAITKPRRRGHEPAVPRMRGRAPPRRP